MKIQLQKLHVVQGKHQKGIHVKFFTVDQNVGISQNACIPNLNFFRIAVFKILQFKIADFPLTRELEFCQYCDRRLTFGKLSYFY